MEFETNYYNDNINMQFNENPEEFIPRDKGLNHVSVIVKRFKNGRVKRKQIKVYTSRGCGAKIRDAETGDYYPHIVGSKDENLYFKVMIATGECDSENKSITAFYCSPQHYEQHMRSDVSQENIIDWEDKRDERLYELDRMSKSRVQNTLFEDNPVKATTGQIYNSWVNLFD